jgi:hypothetical protein
MSREEGIEQFEDRLRLTLRTQLDGVPVQSLQAYLPRAAQTKVSRSGPVGAALLRGTNAGVFLAASLTVAVLLATGVSALRAGALATPTPDAVGSTLAGASSIVFLPVGGRELFMLEQPAGWQGGARRDVLDRATTRWLLLANIPLPVGEPIQGREVNWSAVPKDRVVIEAWTFCADSCIGPTADSSFPLSASVFAAPAEPLAAAKAAGFDLQWVPFRYLDSPAVLTVHVGSQSTAAARDQARAVIASLRPDQPPALGGFHGWFAAGLTGNFAIGSVRHFDVSTPGLSGAGLYIARGRQHFFAFSDTLYNFQTGTSCALIYQQSADEFRCVATGDRWSRFGVPLARQSTLPKDGRFDLNHYGVEVRNGIVLIGISSATATPYVQDESAER